MIQVEILEHIAIPDHFKTDGRVFLELENNRVTSKKNNLGLNDNNRNNNNVALSFTVGYSSLNRILLEPLINAHIRGQTFKAIPVVATDGAFTFEQGHLICLGKDDDGKKYRVQLTNKIDNPLVLADKLALSEIEGLVTFQLSRDAVEAQFPNYKYNDGDPGYRFGMQYFGGTVSKGFLTVEDLRPSYSPLHLFRLGFEQIGYTFSSPILETDIWRSIWCYLSDETYGGGTDENLERFRFVLKKDIPETLDSIFDGSGATFRDWDVIIDNDNNYSAPFYVQPYGLSHEITFEFKIDTTELPRDSEIGIWIFVGPTLVASTSIVLVDDRNIFESEISGVYQEYINQSSVVYPAVVARFTGDNIRNLKVNYRKLYNRPVRLRYIENSYIEMREPLSSQISLGKLLKGVQDLVCGLPDIDWNKQHITLDVSYDVDVWAQAVAGRLKRTPLERIEDIITGVSQKLRTPNVRQSRYVRYGYKKSSDDHIRGLNLEKDTELFDHVLDLGTAYDDRTTNKRNPLFEPTDIAPVPSLSENTPPHLSILSDNDEGNLSYNIGPRIYIATAVTSQNYLDSEGTITGQAQIKWYDSVLALFSTYFVSLENKNVEIVGQDTTVNIQYGSNPTSLWEKYLKVKSISNLLSQKISFKFSMSIGRFSLFDMSTMKAIQYGHEDIWGFVKSISFEHDKESGVIELQAPVDTTADLEGVSETDEDSRNCGQRKAQFKRVIHATNDIYRIVNSSLVDTTTWSYQIINDDGTWPTTWQNFPTTTSIEATRPKITKRNRVRAVVRWVSENGLRCPDSTTIKEFDPCRNVISIQLDDVFDVPNKAGGMRVNLNNSVITGTIVSIASTVRIDQATPVAYNIDINTLYGDFVYPATQVIPNFILETMVITFDNGCVSTLPDPIPNVVINPVDIKAEILSGNIDYDKVGRGRQGRYIPNEGDLVVSKPYEAFDYYYKNDNTGEFGEIWNGGNMNGGGNDGIGPVGDSPWFRARVTFSTGEILFSDWLECV